MLLLAAFNRTYLELKHVQNGYAGSSVAAFNRTYLELKLFMFVVRKASG